MTTDAVVGGKIRLLESIYDDGADHHPPGWLALHGEILIIRAVKVWKDEKDIEHTSLAVSHEDVTNSAFFIDEGEYELFQEQLELAI